MTIDQLKKHVFDFPDVILKNANSIYVYGSVARNDADEDSDCDVFICTNYHSHQEYLFLKKAVSFWESEYGCEFSLYQMDTLQKMWENGSYFLWHIKKEGILLYQQNSEFQNLLNSLPSYRDTKKDFEEYAEILKDIEQSVAYDNTTLIYELSVLAILARNICIGCFFAAIVYRYPEEVACFGVALKIPPLLEENQDSCQYMATKSSSCDRFKSIGAWDE